MILLTHGEITINISIKLLLLIYECLIYSLIKNESERPKYDGLLQMPFILRGERSNTDVAAYVTDILEAMEQDGITQFTTNQPAES